MTRYLAFVFVLFGLSLPSSATIAFVAGQAYSGNTSTSIDTVTVTFTTPPTTGNNIIVTCGSTYDAAANIVSVTDSQSNTYVETGSVTVGFAGNPMKQFLASNITGGASFTVVGHYSANIAVEATCLAVEYSSTTPLYKDVTAQDVITVQPSTTCACGSVTTRVNSEVVVAVLGGQTFSGNTFTPSSGFTSRYDGINFFGMSHTDKIVTSTETDSPTMTNSNGMYTGGCITVTYSEGPPPSTSVKHRVTWF